MPLPAMVVMICALAINGNTEINANNIFFMGFV
jgi:hypothetical protein